MNETQKQYSEALSCFDKLDQTLSNCNMSMMLYEIAGEPAAIVCVARWLDLLSCELDELYRAVRRSWGLTED